MASVASGGTVERMSARIFIKVLRAGWGTAATYSSTFFGGPLPFAAELRLPDFTFFMRPWYKNVRFNSMVPHGMGPAVPTWSLRVALWPVALVQPRAEERRV